MSQDADDRIKEIIELSRLYDVYGGLLSDNNRVVFEDYVLNNYSLAEIAEEVDISRQGVRDTVMRCSAKLRDYEQRLGLLARFDETDSVLDSIERMIAAGNMDSDKLLSLVRKAKDTLEG